MTIWERRPVTRKKRCAGCGKRFIPRRRNQKCCTDGCRMRKLRKKRKGKKQ